MHWRIKDYTMTKLKYCQVLYYIHEKGKNSKWLCLCNCGNLFVTTACSIRDRENLSCGCMIGKSHEKHGYIKLNQRLYKIHNAMVERCYNVNHKQYKHYGGRGIAVCNEWRNDFMNFYEWAMNNGYKEELTIDRVDVNGNYEPTNCRWATAKQQGRNRRTCRYFTINDETHNLSEWCEILNLNYKRVYNRLYKGWSIEKALELE